METMRLTTEQMIEQIKEFDPEYAAEYEQQQMGMLKQWEAIDLELLGQFIGPISPEEIRGPRNSRGSPPPCGANSARKFSNS